MKKGFAGTDHEDMVSNWNLMTGQISYSVCAILQGIEIQYFQLLKKLLMKFSAILCLVVLYICGCNRPDLQGQLLSEQKLLKDSANNITDRIGDYLHKGNNDRAEAEKQQLSAVHGRLIAIQSSLDSLAKAR